MPKKQNQDLIVPPGFSLELIVNRCLSRPPARTPSKPLESHASSGVHTLDLGKPGEEVVNCSPHKLLTYCLKEGLLGRIVSAGLSHCKDCEWL